MDPASRDEFLAEVDEVDTLLRIEHQIKNGLLAKLITAVAKRLPRGSRVHARSKIARVRDRNLRSLYPRRLARRAKRRDAPNAPPNGTAGAPGPGVEVARISRTEVLKRTVTEESNRRLGRPISENELASSLARILLRQGSTGEDPVVALRRIAALAEDKMITGGLQPGAVGGAQPAANW